MIIRESGRNIEPATPPFRLAWAGIVALNQRLTWTGWLALLSVIGFFAVCAVVWTNSDQIGAWLLSQGVVDEAATSALLTGIRNGAIGAGIAGLVAAFLIFLRAVFGIFPWSPLLVAAGYVGTWLWTVISPIVHGAYAALQIIVAWGVSTTRYLGKWLSAICTGVAAIGGLVVNALNLVLAGVIMVIFLPMYGAGALLTLIVRRTWTAAYVRLLQFWRLFSFPITRVGQAMGIVAKHLWHTIAVLFSQIGLVMSVAGQLAGRMLNSATVSLVNLGQGVATVLRYLVGSLMIAMRRSIAGVLVPLAWVRQGLVSTANWTKLWVTAVFDRLEMALKAIFLWARVSTSTVVRPIMYAASKAAAVIDLARSLVVIGVSWALKLLRATASVVIKPFEYVARAAVTAMVTGAVVLGTGLTLVFGLLTGTLTTAFEVIRGAATTVARPIWRSAISAAGILKLAIGLVSHGVAVLLGFFGAGFSAVGHIAGNAFTTAFVPIWFGITTVAVYSRLAVFTLERYLRRVASLVIQVASPLLWLVTALVLYLVWLVYLGARQLLGMASAAAATVRIIGGGALKGGLQITRGFQRAAGFVVRTMWNGFDAAPDVGRAAFWKVKNRKGELNMTDFNLTRQGVISLIGTLWILGLAGAFAGWALWPSEPEPTVEVWHWSTGHLMREGDGIKLLPVMAAGFNKGEHRTESGTLIEVKVHNVPSELIAEYLVPRVKSGRRIDLGKLSDGYVKTGYSDPTIVTPSSAHWLVSVNYEVGRELVDLDSAQSIVRPVIGIVTYEEMARCLGWPEKELGFTDILALRADPLGWERYECAQPQWGKRPLVAFTDPSTSSTGRSLLLSLYSIAAGVPPEELTAEHVNDSDVAGYVKEFQGLIDHYLIGTTVLNTKIHQGTTYGHFFIMPEDNLIHLYEGTEKAFIGGVKVQAPPIEANSMVMIYPKEGSMPRSNCACFVQADWVSPEQVEAGQMWIDYLMEDEQQRNFMSAGFRPGSDISLADPSSKITAEYGLDPSKPNVTLNPSLIAPEVAAEIDKNWQLVKRPGIVTFVMDTSGSMLGTKINQAKDGLILALGNMAKNNQVGFIGFNETIHTEVPVAPMAGNGFKIAAEVRGIRARGETALYDAIKAGIEMIDAAEGPEDAIRAVVVLTDGRANQGTVGLDDLIRMSSRDEGRVEDFNGFENDEWALMADGSRVEKASLIGDELKIKNRHPIQVFFIGIGGDADLEVGRMLAEASGAEFQGVTEKDLAKVLEEFSKYF